MTARNVLSGGSSRFLWGFLRHRGICGRLGIGGNRFLDSSSSIRHLSSNLGGLPKKKSVAVEHTVEEISIPNGHQYGYKIACKVWKCLGGEDLSPEPPIICVHGWLDNANSFDPLIEEIMRPGRVFYVPDLPGHGRSSHIPTTHYNNHTEAHLVIHRVVRYLRPEKFVLLGHSLGAEACVMYAGTYPEGVDKVITLDGVNPKADDWVLSTKVFVDQLFDIDETLQNSPPPQPTSMEELHSRMANRRKGMVSPEGVGVLLQRAVEAVDVGKSDKKYRFTHDTKLRILPGMAMLTKEQFSQFCANVQAPLCVIKSRHNDPMSLDASHGFQDAMELGLKQNSRLSVEFHVVEGGHHVHLDDPSKVSNIIKDFLKRDAT